MSDKVPFWRNKKKIGVHLVFWPIIAVFVIFGVERFGNPAGNAAAVVNDKPISIQEYRTALQRMIDFYSQMTQGNFDEEALKRYRIRETVLQQLVNKELVAQAAAKMGINVTDQELIDAISQIPNFKKDGNFSKMYYEDILRQNRLTPAQFEQGLKTEALTEKARRLFENNLLANPLQGEKQAQLKSRKVNLEYLALTPGDVAKKMVISEAELNDFVSKPETTAKIKEYYDLRRNEYSKPEQVKASHILIKAKKGDPVEEKAAQKKIEQIQNELKTASFAALAKKYSDDPGSKTKGGELGWFEKGRMVPEFEAAAFGQKVGEAPKPVQTSYGFHLIKVEDKKPAQETSLAKAAPEIAKKILAEQKAQSRLNEVEKAVAKTPADGAKAFADLDKSAKWQQTGAFSLMEDVIPQIGADEELSKDVLTFTAQNPTKNKIYKIGGRYIMVKFKNQEAAKATVEDPALDPGARNLAREVFMSWSSKLGENAKIKINNQLFTEEGYTPQSSPTGEM